MRNAIRFACLAGLVAVPSTRAVVLFHDNFEGAAATPYTLKQQFTTPSLQTDSDPLNTVGAPDAVAPGTWFHYHKTSTPAYAIQVTSNIDDISELGAPALYPAANAPYPYLGSYEGSNVLRLRRSPEPPSSTSGIGAVFTEQTSGVVRAKWKMLIPDQQFGLERGITFPAQFFFTPNADNDHSDGTSGSQTPVAVLNSKQTSPPAYLRANTNDMTGSIAFDSAAGPLVLVNQWQEYTVEANIDTQTYTVTVDGMTTSAIPFNAPGGFDTFTFRVAEATSKSTPVGATQKLTGTFFLDDLLIEKVSPRWKVDSNGNWSDSLNWELGVPNGVGAVAEFSSAITQPRQVTVDTPIQAGQVYFDNTQSYSVIGTSTLTIQTSSGAGNIHLAAGNHSITAPVVFASDALIDGTGSLTLGDVTNNGTLTVSTRVSAGNVDGAGQLRVSPNQQLDATRVRQDIATINGTLTISGARSSSKTSRMTSLGIDSLGHVDLGQNDLVVSSTGTSSVSTVRGQITSGYANGAWNGFGLMSSAAGLSGGIVRALGYADNAVLGLTTFGDQSVDSTSVLVRYTVAGDADLNGTVNSLDFNRLVNGFGITSDAYWTQGDFNYDRKVNTEDFNLLAGGFNQTIASPLLGSVVPEPASAGIAVVAVGMLLRRNRKGR